MGMYEVLISLNRRSAAALWALIDIAQERAQTSEAHNFESHAMAYERLLRLANELGVNRPDDE